MLSRKWMEFILACLIATTAVPAFSQVFVQVAPPHAIVERRGRPPGRGFVWVPGYQRWDGRGYTWVRGGWQRPPRGRGRWVPNRWERTRNGWIMRDGHWR